MLILNSRLSPNESSRIQTDSWIFLILLMLTIYDFSAKIMKICDSHNNFPIFSSVLCFIYTLNMITYWNTGNYLVYRRLFLSVIYTLIRIIWAIFIIFLYLTFWYTDCFIITKYFGTLCFCLWNTLFLVLKQSVPSVETILEHFYNL